MIEIDPRQYLPESYVVRWLCPGCGTRVSIKLGAIEKAHCPQCASRLTQRDKQVLSEFKRFIA